MTRNKLYALLLAACAGGYLWLFINFDRSVTHGHKIGVCLFKQLTSIPCPSCGSTRSVLALLRGNLMGALTLNPFGIIIVTVLVVSPVWILYDVITFKQSLFQSYRSCEQFLNRKGVYISAIALVLLNWIWNIYKGA